MEGCSCSQKWREGWRRSGALGLPGALVVGFSLLWLGFVSFPSLCLLVADTDSSEKQSEWPSWGSLTHPLADWQPLVKSLEMVLGKCPKETCDAVTKEGRDVEQEQPSHSLHAFIMNGGLPWWLSGKESACLSRRHGFDLWPGKTPHAVGQLSPCAATTEPLL